MSDSVLRNKSKEFAKKVVFLCRDMKANQKEFVLINQLLRSSTSIGANLHEAQYAQSTNDFISKLEIAQKECYETEYWIELLYETDCMDEEKYKVLQNECGAIRRMLISSLKTIKENKRTTKSCVEIPHSFFITILFKTREANITAKQYNLDFSPNKTVRRTI